MQKAVFRTRRSLILLLLFLLGTVGAIAQTTIIGTVEDSTGEPVIGASVLVKGTKTGASTDLDGKFKIDIPDGNATLVISYVGCKTVEVPAQNGMKVLLEEDSNLLD